MRVTSLRRISAKAWPMPELHPVTTAIGNASGKSESIENLLCTLFLLCWLVSWYIRVQQISSLPEVPATRANELEDVASKVVD